MPSHQPDNFLTLSGMGKEVSPIGTMHIDLAFRHILRGPLVKRTASYIRYVTGEPHPFGNLAILSYPHELGEIDSAMDPLVKCAAPAAVLCAAPSADVEGRLKQAAFKPAESMPAMVVDLDSMASTALPPGYTLSRIGMGPEGDAWGEALAAGYGLPPKVGELFSPSATQATTAADAPVQYFAIRKGRDLVCTSLLYLGNGVAGIYCVATNPGERGKGLAAHATAEPLRLARKLGYRVGVLQSSPMGHSVYRGLGFHDVGQLLVFVRAGKDAE